ncbi:MAG: hypothetical protein KDB23_04545 [Planctomycetales bacterium]|nr:hypothetical protein [Planctomycetales bacterium]
MRRYKYLLALLGAWSFLPTTVHAEVIVADDFYYSQPTKEFGPGGGFTRQDYGGGQNGAAGLWLGRWGSSGDGIILGADVADVEPPENLDTVALGVTFSPTDTFVQRNYGFDTTGLSTIYFGVTTRVEVDALSAPRMYIHNPLNDENQIAIGLDDTGIIAQLGFDTDINVDDITNDGENHQLIGKLEVNAVGNSERLTVWLDPSGVEEGTSAVVESDVIASLDELSGLLRLSRVGTGGRVYFDDVAMGTSWADVATVAVPRLSLIVNETSGLATLVNETSESFDLSYYELESAAGGLAFGSWTSLSDAGRAGWLENAASGSLIVESNLNGSTTLGPGGSLPLGTVAAGGVTDLVARYGTTEGLLNVAPVSIGNVTANGDFDGNGTVDAADIDALSAVVRQGSNDAAFDLTSDGLVNEADRSFLVETVLNTYFGDSNLDNEFNTTDFVTVFTAGQYEDGVTGNSTWATGDWNGDGDFDSSDFVTAFAAGGYEVGPRAAVAAVPEPATVGSCLLAIGLLLPAVRSRRTGR